MRKNFKKITHNDLYFEKKDQHVFLSLTKKENCVKCFKEILFHIKFLDINPGFIFIQTKIGFDIYKDNIPLILHIKDLNYKFLCGTIYKDGHFRAIFYLSNSFYIVDDINRRKSKRIPKLNIITCFYYLE